MKSPEDERLSSVQNAIRLLNVFSVEEAELGISELSDKLGIAKSTVHRLVTTLASEGFIAKDKNTNQYRLGISILALSNVLTSTMPVHQAALPVLHELGKKTKESVLFGIFRGDEVIFLNRIVGGLDFIPALSEIGSRVPAHCTSSGQVFSGLSAERSRRPYYKQGIKALHKNNHNGGPSDACVTAQGQGTRICRKHRGVARGNNLDCRSDPECQGASRRNREHARTSPAHHPGQHTVTDQTRAAGSQRNIPALPAA